VTARLVAISRGRRPCPLPAVVVLHEVFGVNADIRKTCDELADQGFIAVAPRHASTDYSETLRDGSYQIEGSRWFKSRAGFAECYTAPATFWIDLVRPWLTVRCTGSGPRRDTPTAHYWPGCIGCSKPTRPPGFGHRGSSTYDKISRIRVGWRLSPTDPRMMGEPEHATFDHRQPGGDGSPAAGQQTAGR